MGRKKRRTRKLNGAGSITKLSGNRSKPWIVRGPAEIQIDGTVKRPIIGYYATSEDAEIALAKYKINPYNLEDRTTTFNDNCGGLILGNVGASGSTGAGINLGS